MANGSHEKNLAQSEALRVRRGTSGYIDVGIASGVTGQAAGAGVPGLKPRDHAEIHRITLRDGC